MNNSYNMEIVLAYIEFTQFQLYLCPHISDAQVLNKVKIFNLPPSIPVSHIIECKEEIVPDYSGDPLLYSAKIKALKIYSKYIDPHCAEFPINISGA